MNLRLRFLALLTPLALAAYALPSQAAPQDARQKEVEDLRRRLTESEDRMLQMARDFDQEKRRLLQEKDEARRELAKLRREAALGKAKAQLKFDFNLEGKTLTLKDALKTLEKTMLLESKLEGLSGKERLRLRLRGVTQDQLLDAISLNLRQGKGWQAAMWSKGEKGVVTFGNKK